ncbi:MAG: DUF3330 domain-containing protein [Gammaproteobacteria bacterium]|nr:DUF3330 domain-containing protein [Gammaproteobacteria bacterium]
MNQHKPIEQEQVKCEVCLKEIPAAEAAHSETEDYVAHFCGLECYQQWQTKQASTETDRP